MSTTDPRLLVHLADLHLSPRAATIEKRDPDTGRRERDLDMSKAFTLAVDNIIAHDPKPSACVIAGDIFDTYRGDHNSLIDAEREIKKLRSAGIAVVGIAGNHDTPTQAQKTPAYKVLAETFETVAEDDGVSLAYDEIKHIAVGDVEYVLLPHACCLREIDTKELNPKFDKPKSVLVVHGVAAGDPSLSQHDEMKEVPIKRAILEMNWDYVAFGHYHKPGWIPGYEGKAAYCGSLENTVISGPDVCHRRGPVYIDLNGDKAELKMEPQKIREIKRLPDVDVSLMEEQNADEIEHALENLILENDVDDCIVLTKVINIPRAVMRTINRRNFQSVNPRMLYIQTKFEVLNEAADTTKMIKQSEEADEDTQDNENTDDQQKDILATSADAPFKPLAKEVTDMLDKLIENGTIRVERREAVLDTLTTYLNENQ